MSDRTFVDTNVLIYAHDVDAKAKHEIAKRVLSELWSERSGAMSLQVLQEFYVNVTQKIKAPLSRSAAREVVRDYAPWVESPITPATVVRASEIGEIWQLAFWDGMILAAAEQSRAGRLLTEDLSHGAQIAGIEIVDPFR